MSNLRVFRRHDSTLKELEPRKVSFERQMQSLFEENLPELLGITFLESEHSTGPVHAGRIDTLGLDENKCPVIIEYKRGVNENVITQALHYLEWLRDHRGDFAEIVSARLLCPSTEIDWNNARVICIAGDFGRYDPSAAKSVSANLELIRYRQYGDDIATIEYVHGAESGRRPSTIRSETADGNRSNTTDAVPAKAAELFDTLRNYLTELGNDVRMIETRSYTAFRRMKNFAVVKQKANKILIETKRVPSDQPLVPGFTRVVPKRRTVPLEISIQSPADLERAMPLLREAYDIC